VAARRPLVGALVRIEDFPASRFAASRDKTAAIDRRLVTGDNFNEEVQN